MSDEQIKEIIDAAAVEVEGKATIPCAKAFAIHREHGIALKDIGRVCTENGVKIRHCQLGCF